MKSETIKVGHTIKSFGKGGYLKVNIEKPFIQDVKESRYLFIRIEGFLLPYFIEDYDVEASLLKFDEIHNPQECRPLSDTEIYMFTKDVSRSLEKERSAYDVLVGLTLEDQQAKFIGEISGIVEMPKQTLLSIKMKEKDILIPFHESLILDIDFESGFLRLEIAEGLLDI